MKKFIFIFITVLGLSTFQKISAEVNPDNPRIEVKIEKQVSDNNEKITTTQEDSLLYSKLDAMQLLELKKSELEVENKRIDAESKEDMPLNGFGIVMIVLAPFLFVAAIILISSRFKDIESKRKYELYMKSLEMGQTIPEKFFEEPKKAKTNNLKRGLILLMIGVAFGLYLIIRRDNNTGFMLAALIPGFMGLGYLLVHKLEKPKKENSDLTNEQN